MIKADYTKIQKMECDYENLSTTELLRRKQSLIDEYEAVKHASIEYIKKLDELDGEVNRCQREIDRRVF